MLRWLQETAKLINRENRAPRAEEMPGLEPGHRLIFQTFTKLWLPRHQKIAMLRPDF